MKKTFSLLFAFIAILILQSFIRIAPLDQIKYHELKPDEVITFENEDTSSISGSFSVGAYDKTSYTIKFNKQHNLTAKDIAGCKGKHQNETWLIHCSGTIARIDDTIKINAKTLYNEFFLLGIKKNGVVDSFSSDIMINVLSKTLKNEYCPNLVTTGPPFNKTITEIVALPKGISTDEIYKPFHVESTVGIFTYFAVKDSNGKSKVYPAGDYVLIGGNSLSVLN